MRRRKRNIVIELTSLLDVIMILIFMVMNNNGKIVSETQDQLDQVQQENVEQANMIDDLNEQITELSAELNDAIQQLDEEGVGDIWEQLQDAEDRLDGYRALNEVAVILNVSLENKGAARAPCLSFGNPADSAKKSYEWEDDKKFQAAVNELKVFISEQTKQISSDDPDSPTIYVIFSYNPDEVYEIDRSKIDKVLNDAEKKANSTNFIYRSMPSIET